MLLVSTLSLTSKLMQSVDCFILECHFLFKSGRHETGSHKSQESPIKTKQFTEISFRLESGILTEEILLHNTLSA